MDYAIILFGWKGHLDRERWNHLTPNVIHKQNLNRTWTTKPNKPFLGQHFFVHSLLWTAIFYSPLILVATNPSFVQSLFYPLLSTWMICFFVCTYDICQTSSILSFTTKLHHCTYEICQTLSINWIIYDKLT